MNNTYSHYETPHVLYATAARAPYDDYQSEGRFIVEHGILVICNDCLVVCEKQDFEAKGFIREIWKREITYDAITAPILFSYIVSKEGHHKMGRVVINIEDTTHSEIGRYTFKMSRKVFDEFKKDLATQLSRIESDSDSDTGVSNQGSDDEEQEEYGKTHEKRQEHEEEENCVMERQHRPAFVDKIYGNPLYKILHWMVFTIVAVMESSKTLLLDFFFPLMKLMCQTIYNTVHKMVTKKKYD
mmetsp:Transcript_28822/g.32305  ORF Transcript_28822/g.32305 Transcript_28822/m.32305 type:complete len:242 (-) Transcript_28822:135-860(-)